MNITRKNKTFTALGAAVMALTALVLSGCAPSSASAGDEHDSHINEVRVGYFANVTHAPALVGIAKGQLQDALGEVKLKTEVFNAGPAAIEALSAGAIDATYIGPNPAINTFIQSGGASARVIAGATSGGAALVVRDGITSASQLKGTTIASPQLGNTQDVALRSWLKEQGFKTSLSGGGDVNVTPTENAQILTLFQQGTVDGAWVPEPWASRLVLEGGAHVLVNEADLWPEGQFPTTVLLVRKDFADAHPQEVEHLLEGHIASVAWLNDHASEAPAVINDALQEATGKRVAEDVLASALSNVTFTVDPHADTFNRLVKNGLDAGTQKKGSIDGLFDLRALNALLKKAGEAPISAAGLGEQ